MSAAEQIRAAMALLQAKRLFPKGEDSTEAAKPCGDEAEAMSKVISNLTFCREGARV